jgi:DNA-binding transcriptional ArsR family regulator
MDEIIMQVARTVACRARLQILARLAREEELSPTALASEMKLPLPAICAHLRRLSAAGLIQRRRSGAWCYGVARSPYGDRAFSGRVASWLFDLLKQPERSRKQCETSSATDPSSSSVEERLHDAIFDAATAFTNVRRLQVLRRLADAGAQDGESLAGSLKMSRAAMSRHGSKLRRRGYVSAARQGTDLFYEIVRTSKTPIHASLWEFVRAEWRKELRS